MAIEREDIFWLVWCDGGGAPTVKHSQYSSVSKALKALEQLQ